MSGAQRPAHYQITVDSVLDNQWADWFAGLRMENDGSQTMLSGTLQDQSALHGVLDQIRNLGLCILAVRRLSANDAQGESR